MNFKKILPILLIIPAFFFVLSVVKAEENEAGKNRPGVGGELRNTFQEGRKDLMERRDANKDSRNRVLEIASSTRIKVDALLEQRRNMIEGRKDLRLQGTSTLEQRREMSKDIKEFKNDIKDVRNDARGEIKDIRKDMRDERAEKLNGIRNFISTAIPTLEIAVVKVEDRIALAEANNSASGTSITEAKAFIVIAKDNISKVKTLMNSISSSTAQLNASSTKAQIESIKKSIIEIRGYLNHAKENILKALAKIKPEDRREAVRRGTSTTPSVATTTN